MGVTCTIDFQNEENQSLVKLDKVNYSQDMLLKVLTL